jgi:hypothetical protein
VMAQEHEIQTSVLLLHHLLSPFHCHFPVKESSKLINSWIVHKEKYSVCHAVAFTSSPGGTA